MTIDITQPIGDVVRAIPATSRVFERLGIDYCCQGRYALREACERRGLDLAAVLLELEGVQRTPRDAPLDLCELITHIEQTHHEFTRAELTRLAPLAEKVTRVHGATHYDLAVVRKLLKTLSEELLPHMQKEESVLFPYVRALAAGQHGSAPFTTVRAPIRTMHLEHERVGGLFAELSAITRQYSAPEDACASYRALYDGLAALQADIHRHVHLENEILFPAAAQLEARLGIVSP